MFKNKGLFIICSAKMLKTRRAPTLWCYSWSVVILFNNKKYLWQTISFRSGDECWIDYMEKKKDESDHCYFYFYDRSQLVTLVSCHLTCMLFQQFSLLFHSIQQVQLWIDVSYLFRMNVSSILMILMLNISWFLATP